MIQQMFTRFIEFDYVFLDVLIVWLPFAVIILSIVLTLIFRKVLMTAIIVTIIFILFFIYTSTKGVPFGNFYPFIAGYFVISLIVCYLMKNLFRLGYKK